MLRAVQCGVLLLLLAAHLLEGREAAAPGHAHRHDGEAGGRDQRVPRPRRLQRRHVLRRGARHQVARAHPALQHGDQWPRVLGIH